MLPPDINLINKRKMKQKYYIIKLLLKIWFGILCISLLCTTGILWLRTQNIKPVPDMDTSYRGMALAWSILGILALSTGAITFSRHNAEYWIKTGYTRKSCSPLFYGKV